MYGQRVGAMTDIVERLLDPMNGKALLGIRQEAADEVERLTAEFKLILATAPWSDKDGHAECLNIARRALKPKP